VGRRDAAPGRSQTTIGPIDRLLATLANGPTYLRWKVGYPRSNSDVQDDFSEIFRRRELDRTLVFHLISYDLELLTLDRKRPCESWCWIGNGFVALFPRFRTNPLPFIVGLKKRVVLFLAAVKFRPGSIAENSERPPIFGLQRIVRRAIDEYDSDRR